MNTSAIFTSLKAYLDACREAQKRLVICYVDRHGHTIMIWRETDAWLGAIEIAQSKAWTAIAFSGPTEAEALTADRITTLTQPGQSLSGFQNTFNPGRMVIFGGGLPIYVEGRLRGAIGVSGGTVDEDTHFANIALTSYLQAVQQQEQQ
jgi:uncharacterized protein GlcG (DUF336 family)